MTRRKNLIVNRRKIMVLQLRVRVERLIFYLRRSGVFGATSQVASESEIRRMSGEHVKINDIGSAPRGFSEKEREDERKRTSDRDQGSHLARIGTRTRNESSR